MGNCVSRSSSKSPRTRGIEKISARAVNGQLRVPSIRLEDEDEDLEYKVPSAKDGMDRSTLRHELFRYIWQNNFSSPVEDVLKKGGARVLQVGCGSGAWVLDVAKSYDHSTVTGIDSKQIFPSHVPVLNANFNMCDILTGLPFEDNTFDFVFQRFLGTRFTEKEWTEKVLPELVRVTKPGGWIEMMEMDVQGNNEGFATQQFTSGYSSYLTSKGIPSEIISRLEQFLKSFSLMNVQTKEELYPIGNWGNKLGEAALIDHLLGMKDLKSVLAPFLGMNEDEYTQLAIDFKSEVDLFQTYWISIRAFGMKPEDKSVKSESEPKSEAVVESEKEIVGTESELAVKSESEDAK